jgi:MoaA/NifB/PqqE/SkfB family radical SAM enzyme
MTWLKYVTTLSLGGWAETLTNRQFPEILRLLSDRHPHLQMNLCTNGIGLSDAVIDAMAGRLFHLNVSLNAANREEWEKTSRSHGFDHIVEMLKALHRLKQARSAARPGVCLSMVLHTGNHTQVQDFLKLAADVGAGQVQLLDYSEQFVGGQADHSDPRGLQNLFGQPDLRKAVLQAAQERADALGVKLWISESFEGKDCRISRFRRGGYADCWDPWTRCALALDRDSFIRGRVGDTAICCYGVPLGVPYHLDRLDPSTFLSKVWNHPVYQFYRTTVNRRGANCVCDSCARFGIRVEVLRPLRRLVTAVRPERGFGSLPEVQAAFDTINAQFEPALRELPHSQVNPASP